MLFIENFLGKLLHKILLSTLKQKHFRKFCACKSLLWDLRELTDAIHKYLSILYLSPYFEPFFIHDLLVQNVLFRTSECCARAIAVDLLKLITIDLSHILGARRTVNRFIGSNARETSRNHSQFGRFIHAYCYQNYARHGAQSNYDAGYQRCQRVYQRRPLSPFVFSR